ncbi:MAG: hypothetical protein ACKO45_07215 [Cyanobium sp.]
MLTTNFSHLRGYDEQLFRLGLLAERYFPEDPNTAMLKLRQLGEWLAQEVASRFGVELRPEETQQQLLRRLEYEGVLEREVAQLFHGVRRKGNKANHELHDDHATALNSLRMAWQLGVWFHRTFGDPDFRSGPFQPPRAPVAEDPEREAELSELRQALEEQRQWQELAAAAEADKAALSARLAELQAAAQRQGATALASLR